MGKYQLSALGITFLHFACFSNFLVFRNCNSIPIIHKPRPNYCLIIVLLYYFINYLRMIILYSSPDRNFFNNDIPQMVWKLSEELFVAFDIRTCQDKPPRYAEPLEGLIRGT